MANRRMFSKNIIDTDKFLNLSNDAKLLYFYLGLQADDDGFVGSPMMRARVLNVNGNALNELTEMQFIISFESGCIVISDWKENNNIQKDRYTPTVYTKEYGSLKIENKKYILDVSKMDTVSKHNVYTGKDRLDKDKINNVTKFDEKSKEYQLSKYLFEKIKKNDSKARKPNFQNWASDIDKLMRIDKRTYEEIKAVIDFATSDDFWKSNILSTGKLRKQFQRLYLQTEQGNKSKNHNNYKGHDEIEELYPNWDTKPLNL